MSDEDVRSALQAYKLTMAEAGALLLDAAAALKEEAPKISEALIRVGAECAIDGANVERRFLTELGELRRPKGMMVKVYRREGRRGENELVRVTPTQVVLRDKHGLEERYKRDTLRNIGDRLYSSYIDPASYAEILAAEKAGTLKLAGKAPK